ncbi:phage virion morphogenesis protein [Psychromonas ossibalaenae]|uniref:phage virion morphogenesis protein n=1 Tax=Psychromonas ossibalaenae TaxID=444922 RepID=UPI00036DA41D|nr:phage virion morphogenesis protein [Psychromonas ossibalaenae]
MIKISFNKKTLKQVENVAKAIALPPQKRKRLLRRVAANIATASRQNITRQQMPEGSKWAKRKKRRTKRKPKMLLGLRQHIIVSGSSDENHADITLKRGNYRVHAGVLGSRHSKGNTVTAKADKNHYKKNQPEGCSRAQAKTLKALGYEIYARRMNPNAPRGKKIVPTVKFMVENFTTEEVQGAFGYLRDMGLMPPHKKSWQIKTPSRRFLGADKERTTKAWARAFQSMNYGKK